MAAAFARSIKELLQGSGTEPSAASGSRPASRPRPVVDERASNYNPPLDSRFEQPSSSKATSSYTPTSPSVVSSTVFLPPSRSQGLTRPTGVRPGGSFVQPSPSFSQKSFEHFSQASLIIASSLGHRAARASLLAAPSDARTVDAPDARTVDAPKSSSSRVPDGHLRSFAVGFPPSSTVGPLGRGAGASSSMRISVASTSNSASTCSNAALRFQAATRASAAKAVLSGRRNASVSRSPRTAKNSGSAEQRHTTRSGKSLVRATPPAGPGEGVSKGSAGQRSGSTKPSRVVGDFPVSSRMAGDFGGSRATEVVREPPGGARSSQRKAVPLLGKPLMICKLHQAVEPASAVEVRQQAHVSGLEREDPRSAVPPRRNTFAASATGLFAPERPKHAVSARVAFPFTQRSPRVLLKPPSILAATLQGSSSPPPPLKHIQQGSFVPKNPPPIVLVQERGELPEGPMLQKTSLASLLSASCSSSSSCSVTASAVTRQTSAVEVVLVSPGGVIGTIGDKIPPVVEALAKKLNESAREAELLEKMKNATKINYVLYSRAGSSLPEGNVSIGAATLPPAVAEAGGLPAGANIVQTQTFKIGGDKRNVGLGANPVRTSGGQSAVEEPVAGSVAHPLVLGPLRTLVGSVAQEASGPQLGMPTSLVVETARDNPVRKSFTITAPETGPQKISSVVYKTVDQDAKVGYQKPFSDCLEF